MIIIMMVICVYRTPGWCHYARLDCFRLTKQVPMRNWFEKPSNQSFFLPSRFDSTKRRESVLVCIGRNYGNWIFDAVGSRAWIMVLVYLSLVCRTHGLSLNTSICLDGFDSFCWSDDFHVPLASFSLLGRYLTRWTGSYYVSIPAVLELWLMHGHPYRGLALFLLHFGASFLWDNQIYGEVKQSHYSITGLAVVGGLYFLGLEGVLVGPLLVCAVLVGYTIAHEKFLDS